MSCVITVDDKEVAVIDTPAAWAVFESELDNNPGKRVSMFCIGPLWAGQKSESIEELFRVMETNPLRSMDEMFGDFIEDEPLFNEYGKYIWPKHLTVRRAHGNFEELSFGFSIETNDRALIERLQSAINANKQLSAYFKLPARYRAEWSRLSEEKHQQYSYLQSGDERYSRKRVDQIYQRISTLHNYRQADKARAS